MNKFSIKDESMLPPPEYCFEHLTQLEGGGMPAFRYLRTPAEPKPEQKLLMKKFWYQYQAPVRGGGGEMESSPAISRTTNATDLKTCFVTMATAQSPGAFLPFFDENGTRTSNFQLLPEIPILKLRILNFVK